MRWREGAIRHGTATTVQGNCVDTHGQSQIGFGITRPLGFDLLPSSKQSNTVRLSWPACGQPDSSDSALGHVAGLIAAARMGVTD